MKLLNFFATISQEFQPVNVERLPKEVKETIINTKVENDPLITNLEVQSLFSKVNTNKSMTNGDILSLLYKAGLAALVIPITALFNLVSRSGIWPKRWTKDNSYFRKKIPVPLSLDDVRAISKSPWQNLLIWSLT